MMNPRPTQLLISVAVQALMVLIMLAPCPARANDSGFGGTGADLVPKEESRVTMRSEDILIEYRNGAWQITADYVFFNLSDESAAIQVGFPEMKCPDYGDCDARFGKPRFTNTTSASRPWVELTMEKTDWTPKEDLHVNFHYSAVLPPALAADRLERSGLPKEAECEGFPAPSSLESLRICKNLIFAISGYSFKDQQLQKYFYGASPQGWHQGRPHWAGTGESVAWIRGLQELPGFAYASMPKQNRWFIDYLEKEIRPTLQAQREEGATAKPTPEKIDSWRDYQKQKASAAVIDKGASSTAPASGSGGSKAEPNPAKAERESSAPPSSGCACSVPQRPLGDHLLAILGLPLMIALARGRKTGCP